MTKISVWKTIATRITRDIAKGHYESGSKLPSEAELSKQFSVNRHTVRHAISALVEDGLVYTKHGSGTFVATKSIRYNVGKRVRFHQSAQALGHNANKRILNLSTRAADDEERKALKLRKGTEVHIFEGIGLIAGMPISHFIAAFPAKRFPDMLENLSQNSSITNSFKVVGITDYTRTLTRITSVIADTTTAKNLNLKTGSALLRSISINSDMDGKPIEYGRTWFSGDHIELTIEN
jgi:GntR family phosphonate transport system transcriptional regulator